MVLVDTSVWISHLRDTHRGLVEVLDAGQVVCHPFVIGELACGGLKNRTAIMSALQDLPRAEVVQHEEVLTFIAARGLMGKGLGCVDVHLLASALVSGAALWTLDRRLCETAAELGCAYAEAS